MIRCGRLLRSKFLRQHEVEEVVDRGGDEEVLLLQPQLLALRRGVLGVEHLGDVLREGLRADGLLVVAGVEDPQVERVGGDRPPQPQRVHPAVLVAGDHVVVRDGLDLPARHPAGALDAVGVGVLLGVTAEGDDLRGLGVRELPRRAEGEPGVGLLDLAAVDEGLPEDAVLVADAVADAGHAHGGQRVDEAGGQPTQTAVAQTRLDLLGPQRRPGRCRTCRGPPRRSRSVRWRAGRCRAGGRAGTRRTGTPRPSPGSRPGGAASPASGPSGSGGPYGPAPGTGR